MHLLSKIAEIISGTYIIRGTDKEITKISTDSRHLFGDSNDLFIALKGPNFNGIFFLKECYDKGIRNFIVEDEPDGNAFPDCSIIKVNNATTALQQIAGYHREQFNIPVVGITGSNGKTIVKEWLNTLLQDHFQIVRSPGSYNSQIGVPLSLWEMDAHHNLGIFEAGISRPGEMEKLQRVMQPTVGVFTSLGDAHSEGFESADQKLHEKLKLFKSCSSVVIPYELKNKLPEGVKSFTWSTKHKDANLFIEEVVMEQNKSRIQYVRNEQKGNFVIPFTDQASIENAITCMAAGVLLGQDLTEITKRMLLLQPVEMRMVLQRGIQGHILINDSYNADLHSLKNALDFMDRQSHKGPRVVVLSDMLQLGKQEEQTYKEVSELLNRYPINQFIGVGAYISKHHKWFGAGSLFFETTEACAMELNSILSKPGLKGGALILLKGARKFRFEKLASGLVAQRHSTQLEIHLNAIAHNFQVYKKLLNPSTKVMVMVKAFSYGSGSNEIAALLQYRKADYLAVAYADEGIQLRQHGINLPIMVMNTEEKSFDALAEFQLEPAVYSMNQLELLARANTGTMCIHLELETGMHRLGIEISKIDAVLSFLEKQPHLKLKSMFSHLASAEDPLQDEFTREQIQKLAEAGGSIRKQYPDVLLHVLNSPGITRWAEAGQFDMVRLGIGLYGFDPSGRLHHELIPASVLKSTISQVKELQPGDGVSYNRRFVATSPMRIATIPIGYADGLHRGLGNGKGAFRVKGKMAKILGTICMDMTMIDITDIACKEGDEVILFGDGLPVQEMAANAGTIAYEILSTLSQRITRVYVSE